MQPICRTIMKEKKKEKSKTTTTLALSSPHKGSKKSYSKAKPYLESKRSERNKSHGQREKDVKKPELKSENVKKKTLMKEKLRLKDKEKEDGEVSGEDSSFEDELPVCRFYSTKPCTWGRYCRFRHPGSNDMGNYMMFDQAKQSFEHSLQDFKQIMDSSVYKNAQDNDPYVIHKPWIEFNDLDADPYYTNYVDLPMSSQYDTQLNHPYQMDPDRKVTFEFQKSPSSSSESTSDYTSTTNSSSSSLRSCCSKSKYLRKSQRRGRDTQTCISSSDSESYVSTTNSSQCSSSSVEFNIRKLEFKKRILYHSQLERRRRRYLKRKLKYVEAQISEKKKKLKWE